ncbi:hypothetical protein SAMN05443662_1483 [Sulfurivirga caldicuralii]|uniref:Porin n=1 Tax=Sulfurivirga caldicuralii TaxID=364032 RepID=A0A1N6GT48_9GAMM|nr:hypothetical protein [Sulfurivirga caldicuralii]SIO10696.1 hypothetical protein SAMN05443662_1483 [Sulfurivirga caldicuralii]
MSKHSLSYFFLIWLVTVSATAAAPAEVSGNLMWTHQRSDLGAVKPENTLSGDFLAEGHWKQIGWLVHLEGNNTPDARGPSALGAQAAAGVATDKDGEGRIQLSEAFASFGMLNGQLHIGLIDLAGFADTSDVANDETTQFLNADLVNNSTISFPDHDLGLAWTSARLNILLAKNTGLADNGSDYHRLFSLTNHRTGIFTLAETHWLNESLHIGAWYREGAEDEKDSWGTYLTTDQSLGGLDWNLRLGWADDTAQDAARFASLAAQKSWNRWTLGLGHATTLGSGPLNAPDRHMSEGYLRYRINAHWDISADVQFIRQQTDTWVYGARALWHF